MPENGAIHLDDPIMAHVRRDFPALRIDMTVEEALAAIRRQGLGERIVYFYVAGADGRLVGVLPTRRLLGAEPAQRLAEILVSRVVAIPHTATVLEACELFVLHRFLALPVLDGERRMVGVVDVNLFTEEVFDLAERGQTSTVFEAIGFRVAELRDASPLRVFRFRFPWLLATIASGIAIALLASAFEATLAQSLVLAFFLALVLALGESVSIQSMTVAIQALRASRPTLGWYARALRREAGAAFLLGGASGVLVGLVVYAWRGAPAPAIVIAGAIWLSLGTACFFGLSVPAGIHALRLDPKIAAGPLTLALTDLLTVVIYFTLAAIAL